jgi:uncharacterized membrane protein
MANVTKHLDRQDSAEDPEAVQPATTTQFRSPIVNGAILSVVILLVGFMAYNYAGHQMTQLAAESVIRALTPTPTPRLVPTVTDTPMGY